MAQSVKRSWQEAWVNIGIGFFINYIANLLVLKAVMGYNVTLLDNVYIGLLFTVISLLRQFVIRRWFSKGD